MGLKLGLFEPIVLELLQMFRTLYRSANITFNEVDVWHFVGEEKCMDIYGGKNWRKEASWNT